MNFCDFLVSSRDLSVHKGKALFPAAAAPGRQNFALLFFLLFPLLLKVKEVSPPPSVTPLLDRVNWNRGSPQFRPLIIARRERQEGTF